MYKSNTTSLIYLILYLCINGFTLTITACGGTSLADASRSYRSNRDYTSLVIIAKSLHTGMQQQHIIDLLGEPDHSPIDGLYYYSSDKNTPNLEEQTHMVNHGLMVDYRAGEVLTKQLQAFTLGPIGE